MGRVERARDVPVAAEHAWRLWTDPARWPTFVEGFKHVERVQGEWPRVDGRIQWASTPGGRGRVTEKVLRAEPGALLVTQVFEEALTATQTVAFIAAGDGPETWVEVALAYELTQAGWLKQLTDVLFIRRELGAALERTLRRFAAEAAEEAAL